MKKILVTDDDPEMRKVITLVLESLGYQVSTATSGEDALTKIEEEKPDLLILDVFMPKMDGFEVCKRLNERAESGGCALKTPNGQLMEDCQDVCVEVDRRGCARGSLSLYKRAS